MGKRGMTPSQAEEVRVKRGIGQDTKLRKKRIEKGFSQNDLATVSGVNVKTIRRIEQKVQNVEATSLDALCRLCEVLECRVGEIIDNEAIVAHFRK